jgi:hypothetical protein
MNLNRIRDHLPITRNTVTQERARSGEQKLMMRRVAFDDVHVARDSAAIIRDGEDITMKKSLAAFGFRERNHARS